MFKKSLIALFSTLMLTSGMTTAEEANTGTIRDCIPIKQISRIEVIDKQHLMFHMTGGKKYLNTLPRTCQGLSKHKPIMYKTSLSQLCSVDFITVLESIGGGFQRGASCGLGTFERQKEK